ncbi:hypothetical protein ABT093_09550 [Kitasatospora sp. NPDC002551]|uniref:hypothetical protein n=1 Tax=Kitasatospora sp. NPDC002551 TaxID=3154539 RepID=UPI00332F7EA2
MSDRIPPDRQSRWRDQRGSSRGPGRTGRTTLLPPGVIPAEIAEALEELGPTDEEEDTEVAAQKKPSGRPGPAGDPKAPPAGPHTPPPPSPPQDPPEK